MVGVCNHSRESSTLDCGDGCISVYHSVYHEHVIRSSTAVWCVCVSSAARVREKTHVHDATTQLADRDKDTRGR